MKHNIYGGGKTTNLNGLSFEEKTCIKQMLKTNKQIEINEKNQIFFNGNIIGFYTEKHKFYNDFLKPLGINYKDILSKKLLPDGVFVNIRDKKIFIVEKKFQIREGSVDEKLQTGVFKKKMFSKLCDKTGYKVEYFYLLNNWFKKDVYRDVKEYLVENGCGVFIDKIPLHSFGL
jgi:hypothetical protein